MPSDFTNVPVSPLRAVQVCPPLGKGSTLTLYNPDISNVVYVGRQPNFPVGSPIALPIQPLTSAVLPANTALYATAATNISLVIIPDGGTLTPSPSQIAQQIALSGISSQIPKLVDPQRIIGSNNINFTFTVPFTTGGSYMIVCDTQPGNAQVADITIKHLDANSNVIYTEVFTVGTGTIGNNNPAILRGNLQGTQLQFVITTCTQAYLNALAFINGPFAIGSLLISTYQTANPVAEPRPKMVPSNVQGGYLQGFSGIALATNASQGPVSIPPYAGRAIIDLFSPGPLWRGTIQGFRVQSGSTPQYTQRIANAAASSLPYEIIMPQMLTSLTVLNGDASSRTGNVNLMACDYL